MNKPIKQHGYLCNTDEGLVVTSPLANSSYNQLCIQEGYQGLHVGENEFIVSVEDLNEFFEPMENLNTLEYRKEQESFESYTNSYKRKDFDYCITVSGDLNSDYDEDEVFEENIFRIQWIFYKNDDKKNTDDSKDDLNRIIRTNNDHSSKISVVLKTNRGFEFKEQKIKPLDIDIKTMYNDDFAEIHEHIVDELQNGKKGLIALHGVPGSGKTNYIKHLTTLVPSKKFIFVTSSIVPYLTDPSFISELIDNKGAILVLEDCENYIKDRELSGENGVVSTILNVSDGILSDVLEMQLILTFNTERENIDSALLRDGRLIADYYFDKLSSDKVAEIMEAEGIDDTPAEMTLAEVFNLKNKKYKSSNKQSKIGFK